MPYTTIAGREPSTTEASEMQISKATVTATAKCKRCNGAGFGTWRADWGTCWGCDGAGVVGAAWVGSDVTVQGYVARPRAIERGTAKFQSVLLIQTSTPADGTFRLTVRTTLLDGSVHTWETTDRTKAEAAHMRVIQVEGGVRDMVEAQLQAAVAA